MQLSFDYIEFSQWANIVIIINQMRDGSTAGNKLIKNVAALGEREHYGMSKEAVPSGDSIRLACKG